LLYESLKKLPKAYILGYIARTHTRFDMTTKEGYLSLREKYNKSKYPLDLLLLAFSSFTNYIRFNSKGEFNMPYGRGKRCITEKQYLNLVAMIDKLSDIDFLNKDFADVDPHPDEFVYCDPPYLLANATYNSGWSDKDEKRLLDYLWDIKDTNNFALSNVTHHKGLENKRLIRFMRSFNTLKVDIHYGRCNYQSKMSNTVEVIVHNVNK
jgi:DNA adenine methylase Dam